MPICKNVNQKDARSQSRTNYTVPDGVISLWVGDTSEIPSGWLVCDGNNGTPNLNERYPRIVNSGDGNTGGTNSVTSNGHNHNGQWRAPSRGATDGYDFSLGVDCSGSTCHSGNPSTTSVSVDTRPSTIDYVFIQSDGSGQFIKGVSTFKKDNKSQINKPLSVNDGSNGVPNSSNRNLRGSTSNSGSRFGSDSANYSHSHGWADQTHNNMLSANSGMTNYDGVGGPNTDLSFNTFPNSVKFYIASEMVRYGLKNKTDFEGSMFFYEGNVSNLPSGWSQITSYSGLFVRFANTDSELENVTSNQSWSNLGSHKHNYNTHYNDIDANSNNVYVERNPDCKANNGNISRSLPPYYDLKLIEVTSA